RREDKTLGAHLGRLFKYALGGLYVVVPGDRPAYGLAGREADDASQVHDGIRLCASAQQLAKGVRLAHIRLDELEIGMGQVRYQRIAAKEQLVHHGDLVAALQQLAYQQRADVAGAAGDYDML